jgi:DNA invertase Pin-like site-specific DNA recombinase
VKSSPPFSEREATSSPAALHSAPPGTVLLIGEKLHLIDIVISTLPEYNTIQHQRGQEFPAMTEPARTYPVAFSYRRFSSPSQADGDSIRRQNALSVAWSDKTSVPLDLTLTLEDRGVSGFKGITRSDPERYALAAFLKAIEIGRVQPGDYLLIENLDRLSREHEVPATHLLTSILMTGVKVVQLSPYELELTDKSDGFTIMRAVMELSRGHGESVIKSERIRQAKAQRRAAAAAGKVALTSRLPAWLELGPDQLPRIISARAAVIRKIFNWAMAGYGLKKIVARLITENIPAFGSHSIIDRKGRPRHYDRWNRAYIGKILRDRRVLGEFNSRGTIIPLPAIISPSTWEAARMAAKDRARKPGRICNGKLNLFAHLLHEAKTGSTFHAKERGAKYTSGRVLVTTQSAEGTAPMVSFNYDTFETAILTHLREIDPAQLCPDAQDHTIPLASQLAQLQERRRDLEQALEAGDAAPKAAIRVLAKLEAQEKALEEQLRTARQQQAHPTAEAWRQAQSLLTALKRGGQDTRLRLRSLLRRIIAEISLLVIGRGADRLAAAQIWFVGGEHRDYLILHRPPWHDRPGLWRSRSLYPAHHPDLRQPRHAQALEKKLLTLDLSTLLEQPPPRTPATAASA